MNQKQTSLIYFSPTGTTRKVLEQIASGLGCDSPEIIDITSSAQRNLGPAPLKGDIVLLGAPVYAGRIPKDAVQYFKGLKGNGKPAVLTVVYGNREFEDALLELKTIAKECGFIPVAGAAFIGEHSFSCETFPIAVNRPDKADLETAADFGRQVAARAGILDHPETAGDLAVPGNFPYREGMKETAFAFMNVSEDCTGCGTCAEVCPKEAIDEANGYTTMDDRCIFCCACIKACPENARSLMDGPIRDTAKRLHENCAEPKAPVLFF
ncbi:MAG: 4Fe-4S binding protein [Desulfobacter sp.]|nr:MAG: 4Fe-4S binding protein [Desulfobacter sp.]